MKKLEVLISTMNISNIVEHKKLLKKMNIKGSSLTINQCPNINSNLVDDKNSNNRIISFHEKGLSKSRNKAIKNSIADICVIADDDLTYNDNYEQIILEAYEKYKDADIIAFKVKNIKDNCKLKESRLSKLQSFKLCSVQLTFRRKSIESNKIGFDEKFGTGSEKYVMGEENIFLSDCIKSNLKIYYIPKEIAILNNSESTWFKGYDEKYFISKGACFYRISHLLSFFLILQFAIRKYNEYKNKTTLLLSIKYMNKGRKEIKKQKIYFIGDILNNTGPAIVNKSYYKYLKNDMKFCFSNNKIVRIIHYTFYSLNCNYVILSGFSKLNYIFIKIAKMLNKKTFYLMHGFIKEESKYQKIENSKERIELEYMLLKKVDKIICVSDLFSQYLIKTYPEFKEKITYVNNGIIDQNEIIEKIENKYSTLISVGGGSKQKNNLIVCKALETIKFKGKFIIIGALAEDGEKIKKYKFVEYYESLSHDEVINKMKCSNLYIQNSYFETFGLAVVEALNVGCDLLISKNVGALSVLENTSENDTINNNEDINEISKKIKNKLVSRSNISYNKETCSWKNRSKELLTIITK